MKPFKLENHPKIKPGFTVPENYFENFQATMMQKIASDETPDTNESRVVRVIPLNQKNKSWWYAAAAVLIMALSIPAINAITSNEYEDTSTLDSYFAYTDISDDQLVELLEFEDIDKIQIDYNLEDAAIEDALQTGIIENYIID